MRKTVVVTAGATNEAAVQAISDKQGFVIKIITGKDHDDAFGLLWRALCRARNHRDAIGPRRCRGRRRPVKGSRAHVEHGGLLRPSPAPQLGQTSAREATKACLDRLRAVNPKLNAVVQTFDDAAVAFGLGIEVARIDTGERIGHFGIGDKVAPAHDDTVDTEIFRGQVGESLAEKAPLCLDAGEVIKAAEGWWRLSSRRTELSGYSGRGNGSTPRASE